ncbi:unnamed protein product [Mytilus coruscus]|uniref:Uncharacterized protein n=1 Tax=Mytilus coruscus TaxID=42192 RepID=A0A6J8AER4_MYTCO|nr:unnamed protein product [Mytilus coruscus]
MTNLEKTFAKEIKDNIGKLKDEMTLEFAQVDNKIKELELKMTDIELNQTQNVNNKMNSVNSKLVFKNVTQIDDENEDSLKDYVHGLLRSIELEIDIMNVYRINTPNNGNTNSTAEHRPKPLIVTMANDTQRDSVLKNKFKLNKITMYKKCLHRARPIEA